MFGTAVDEVGDVRYRNLSSPALVSSGAPSSFQSGNNSSYDQ